MNFADRCNIATACLPRDDYRAKLEALHAEMLSALEAARAEVSAWRERCPAHCYRPQDECIALKWLADTKDSAHGIGDAA